MTKELNRSSLQGLPVEEKASVILDHVTKQYAEDMEREGLSIYSIRHEESNIRTVLTKLPKDLSLSQLNQECLESVFSQFRNKEMGSNKINDLRKTLVRVLGHAVRTGHLESNLALGIPKVLVMGQSIRPLS